MHFIYWIYYPHHTDPFTEGYVGISKNPDHRYIQHKNGKGRERSPIVTNAIKKGNTILTVLSSVEDIEQAKVLEEQYRPEEHIGWNIAKGGLVPPNQKGKRWKYPYKRQHSDETKEKMSAAHTKNRWWNDGTKNIRSEYAPEGYVLGRLKNYSYSLTEEGRSRIGRAGRKISTPHGHFDTIKEAATKLNLSWGQVYNKVKSDKHKEWHYL